MHGVLFFTLLIDFFVEKFSENNKSASIRKIARQKKIEEIAAYKLKKTITNLCNDCKEGLSKLKDNVAVHKREIRQEV
jgi:hypothetical protein